MNELEKLPYIQLFEQDKQRREGQLEEMKQNGFFVMKDGTKSIDPQNQLKTTHKKNAPQSLEVQPK